MADIALVDAGRSAAKEEGHSSALDDEEQIPICGSFSAKVECSCKPCIFFFVTPYQDGGYTSSLFDSQSFQLCSIFLHPLLGIFCHSYFPSASLLTLSPRKSSFTHLSNRQHWMKVAGTQQQPIGRHKKRTHCLRVHVQRLATTASVSINE